MSNETDLDWLARNVHAWPAGDHQPWCYVGRGNDGDRFVSGMTFRSKGETEIRKGQWLARRAELQNKPSWKEAPDGGGWSMQVKEGRRHFIKVDEGQEGEALGDWRDTLERRPNKFQPLTSIEDNQEREVKQDNGWFERGELPPVGVECEIFCDEEWEAVFVVGSRRNGDVVVELGDGNVVPCINCKFRPIRTEREVAIDEMCNVAGLDGLVFGLVAGKLYDAGYRKGAK